MPLSLLASTGAHLRLLTTRLLRRLGFGENGFLVPVAVVVGIVTAVAAVAFHELIIAIRDGLFRSWDPAFLYGPGLVLIIVIPALGGLAVGLFSTYLMRSREGHGVIDVMETVLRSSGFIRPLTAIEKILTSAMTIGSGGSAGAEGPIVQIGAAISSGIGQLFQITKAHLPVLIGCGAAAGISAIFSSPIGGVLFTLEVILLDFSIRAFTPVVISSVIAFVTTQAIYTYIKPGHMHAAIFFSKQEVAQGPALLDWGSMPTMALLGLLCGLVGVTLTKMMYLTEDRFHRIPINRAIRPAIGGAAVGVMGVAYVLVFGWLMTGGFKPVPPDKYPMPAFFGDGYGVIQLLLVESYPAGMFTQQLIVLLVFLIFAKILATCLTLSSGGSGGVIAPSLFLGATTGALVGISLKLFGYDTGLSPGFYALVGMGAVLAAVVHAPLASILIVFEVTGQKQGAILPAMLACVISTGTARLIFKDSVYTLTLRRRGISVGTGGDLSLLRRMTVEQVDLEPVNAVPATASFEELLAKTADAGSTDMVVVDRTGNYAGMVVADDVKTALMQHEAIPLLLVEELLRPDLPCVRSTDDLAAVLETFSRHEVGRLPVCLAHNPSRIIGLVSRKALMRAYHKALSGA